MQRRRPVLSLSRPTVKYLLHSGGAYASMSRAILVNGNRARYRTSNLSEAPNAGKTFAHHAQHNFLATIIRQVTVHLMSGMRSQAQQPQQLINELRRIVVVSMLILLPEALGGSGKKSDRQQPCLVQGASRLCD